MNQMVWKERSRKNLVTLQNTCDHGIQRPLKCLLKKISISTSKFYYCKIIQQFGKYEGGLCKQILMHMSPYTNCTIFNLKEIVAVTSQTDILCTLQQIQQEINNLSPSKTQQERNNLSSAKTNVSKYLSLLKNITKKL